MPLPSRTEQSRSSAPPFSKSFTINTRFARNPSQFLTTHTFRQNTGGTARSRQIFSFREFPFRPSHFPNPSHPQPSVGSHTCTMLVSPLQISFGGVPTVLAALRFSPLRRPLECSSGKARPKRSKPHAHRISGVSRHLVSPRGSKD